MKNFIRGTGLVLLFLTLQLYAAGEHRLPSTIVNGQLSVGDSSPASASAALDVKGASGGVLLNRVTNASAAAIVSPPNSLTLFNTNKNFYQFYASSAWNNVVSSVSSIPYNRALFVDSNGYASASVTTSTELSYVSGATTNIQTQINGKVSSTGTSSYIPRSASSTALVNSIAYDTGSAIGIGLQTVSGASLAVNGPIATGSAAALQFTDADGSNYVALKASGTVNTNVTWSLPTADGASGQFLKTNGGGVLSWGTGTGGSGIAPSSYSILGSSGTYTTPVGATAIWVRLIGGGGGGAASGSTPGSAGTGGDTTFSSATAGGAAGRTGGTYSGCDSGSNGGSSRIRQNNDANQFGFDGVPGPLGGNGTGGDNAPSAGTAAPSNSGGGGGGAGNGATGFAGAGGGAGAYCEKLFAPAAASYAYGVGSGGSGATAGGSGAAGGNGADGRIDIIVFY